MRIELDCVIETAFGALQGLAALCHACALSVKQVSAGKVISDLRILAVSVAQVLEYTYCLRCLTFTQTEQAVDKQRVVVDGILGKNVLHAGDAVLVLTFRTCDFSTIQAGGRDIA